ncbi:hypothetical protein [Actinoplanes sp. RD1]|uniref:hypothetical protein n=1 Tax=Actinoplanes sp. RD1 TaxID=3064538 RepID=UPI002740C3EE|nr:hypothetical protein [Actinoplanes sp. RD1]
MGSSYQTVLATGELGDVRAAVTASGGEAVVRAVAAGRWAVVPRPQEGYADTAALARLLTRAPDAVAATFDVIDSDLLVAGVFRAGRSVHDYLSEQSIVEEGWDENDNEILFDGLGRTYPPGATVPSGPYGADAAVFAPLAAAPVDEAKLTAVLAATDLRGEDRHHQLLHLLAVDPAPLQMSYEEALAL